MKHKSQQRKTKSTGFVLRGAAAVIILLVAAAAVFFGIFSYMKYDRFKTYSERARNIYVAAQKSLDAMSDEAFEAFAANFVQEGADSETVYFQVKGALDAEGRRLFEQLTKGYIYNNDIIDGAVGIEIKLSEKKVTAVACADEKLMLTREGSDGRNHVNFKNKDSEQRQKKCIGYFDEQMLLTEEARTPEIGSVSLENGDVLEIVFELGAAERRRIGEYGYEVELRKGDAKTVMKMTVNDSRSTHLLPAEDVAAEQSVTVTCRFYGHGALDTKAQITFPAYIDSNYRAHIVLDALDVGTAQKPLDENEDEAYRDSYSAMRFAIKAGLKAEDNISVGVRPVDADKETITYSGEESLLMSDSDGSYFKIANARHLFNMRFINASCDEAPTYEQTESFAWGNSDFGIVGAGHVFENGVKQKKADFIPIDSLREGSVFTASKGSVIEGLTMTNTQRQDGFGLFRENSGVIEKLTINGLVIESSNNYTGGICGINYGTVKDCELMAASVTGGVYTGGIAGSQTDGQISEVNFDGLVKAWGYGGAISGISLEKSMIEDCTVNAAVYAKEGFCGGIVGYNSGLVADSTFLANLQSAEGLALLEAIAQNGPSGDYTGGIVGYNEGRLTANETVSVTPAIFGRNYTGGIVGFNAPGAFVGDYVLEGGYIKGRACVGGLLGFNGSALFMNEETHTAKPQNIYGDFYVGGMIGANAVETSKTLNFSVAVDNEAGTVTSNGSCVGGVIGYNVLLSDNSFSKDEKIIDNSEAMAARLVGFTYDTMRRSSSSEDVTAALENMQVDEASVILKLQAENEVCLKAVTGCLYVGGLIGMQQEESALYIGDTSVNTSVKAFKTVDFNGIQTAFAGILMGRVPQNTTLYGCSAAKTAQLSHNGEVLGILAEINEGHIENCESYGISMGERSGIGGIVGLNEADDGKEAGTITGCTLNGELTAKAFAGGIAVINRGSIFGCDVSGFVTAKGDIVGGIAAMNDGVIGAFDDDGSEVLCEIEADISGGNNVGGAVGINKGAVSGCEISSKGLLESRRSISGLNNVGGFIGLQKDCTGVVVHALSLPSYADVSGNDCVGGIVGRISGRAVYDSCESFGNILTSKDMAGGIAGMIGRGAIVRGAAAEDIKISAPDADYIGGIAGFNAGEIENCTVRGETKITGIWRVGGIAGENTGDIKMCSASQISLILKENTAGSCVGGIAGENTGNIENSTAQQSTKTEKNNELHIQSWVDDSYMGGIAGKNSGKIISTNASIKINTGAVLAFLNDAGGACGGIAGENTGDIRYYRFTGQIENGGRGSAYMGGIVGINGSANGTKAHIESCYVYDRQLNERALTAQNKADNGQSKTVYASGENSTIGGIVGVNYKYATVKSSVPVKCYMTAAGGVLGGIAGYNNGTLLDCKPEVNHGDEGIRVKLYSAAGTVGAIAGKSDILADERGCFAGVDWYYGEV